MANREKVISRFSSKFKTKKRRDDFDDNRDAAKKAEARRRLGRERKMSELAEAEGNDDSD